MIFDVKTIRLLNNEEYLIYGLNELNILIDLYGKKVKNNDGHILNQLIEEDNFKTEFKNLEIISIFAEKIIWN